MGKLIARRLLQMLLIMLTVAALLFTIFDSEQFRKKIAVEKPRVFHAQATYSQ